MKFARLVIILGLLAFLPSLALANLSPVTAPPAAPKPEDVSLIARAIDVAVTMQDIKDLNNSFVIPILAQDYQKFRHDSDLGALVGEARYDEYDALVVLMLSSANRLAVYFKGGAPEAYAQVPTGKALSSE